MGPNGAGVSTLAYVLAVDPLRGDARIDRVQRRDLLDLELHERAAAGLFLGPVPGRNSRRFNLQFLREALNAQRRARGEEALTGGEFLKLAKDRPGCSSSIRTCSSAM